MADAACARRRDVSGREAADPHSAAALAAWPPDAGREGPLPAPLRSIASAICSSSETVRDKLAASIQPLTCAGLLAPTIAPVTPGHARVHATATAPTSTLLRLAMSRMTSAR